MIDKMIRAARLDRTLYNEVESNENETSNALIVVVLAALAAGLGSMFFSANPIMSLLGGLLSTIAGWIVSAFLIYFVGTRVYGATATVGEVMRTTGYAQSVGILSILTAIPVVGWILAPVIWIWSMVATYVGVKEALDLDTTKTIITIVLAIIAWIIIAIILGTIFGVTAAGMGALFGRS